MGRIFFADDLIAENRLNMRSTSQGLETNGLFSSDMKRESRRQYEVLRSIFEGEMRKDQEIRLSNVLVSLGPPPNLPMDELRRRLLEIHPRLPITGTLTNLLPPSSTVVQNEPR